MFVPYPYRPFWHPNTQSVVHQDVAELTRKLNKAEKKVDEYARLVASLYADLRRYQDTVCRRCSENIHRASLATAHPPYPTGFSSPASQPTAATLWSDPTNTTILTPSEQVQACPTSELQAAAELSSFNPTALIVTTSSPDNPQIKLSPTTTTPTVSAHSADSVVKPPQSAFTSIPETATDPVPSLPNPEWSVEYNPDIKQDLSLHVTKTFAFKDTVYCTKFSRDGKFLAVGLENGEIHIYNMTTGFTRILARRHTTVFYTDAPDTPSSIFSARFSLDNKYIATGGGNGEINIWEIDRGRLRASFKHESVVRCIDISPNSRFLVSASYDASVCIWRLRDGSRRPLLQYEASDFMSVAFSPDGRYVAAGNDDGLIRIWDARSCRLVTTCKFGDPYTYLRSVIFTPDGKRIASGGETVQCWDLNSRREVYLGLERHVIKGPMNEFFKFKRNKEAITALSFLSDNLRVVASSMDHNVYILDASSGAWVCTLKAHMDTIWGADSSPAGRYIVSGGEDRFVRLWMYEIVE